MLKTPHLSSFVVIFFIGSFLACDHDLNPIELTPTIYIAKFPDDKAAAVSFTFDDNCRSSFTNIAPLFESNGYRATFFIIAGFIKSDGWAKWRDLSEKGFEIGNHSLSHPNLTKLDSITVTNEVEESYELIKNKIGKAPLSFAPPYHKTNSLVDKIVRKNHLFSRTSPKGFCNWDGWISNTKLKDVFYEIDLSIKTNKWYVGAAHGVGDGWEPLSESFLKEILDYCKTKESQIVVETFQNIALYRLEARSATLSIIEGENKKTIKVESNLSQDVYGFPLTIVIKNHHFPSPFKIYNLTTGESLAQPTLTDNKLIIPVYLNNTYEIRWRERS